MKIIALFTLFSLACAATPPTAPSAPAKLGAAKLIAEFQKSWAAMKTFQASFNQSVDSKQLGLPPDESEGTLSLIRPDKLRWEVKTDGSFQIINGTTLTVVRPNARRGNATVDIYPDINKIADTRALKFFTGQGKIESLYNVKMISEGQLTAQLKLTPKSPSEDQYIAEISKKSYVLESLTTETTDSKVVVKFKEIKTNGDIKNDLFAYTPKPKDTVQKH